MARIIHVQATIGYVEERIRDRVRQGLPQDYVELDGQPIDPETALLHLSQMRADGLRLVPCGCDCDAEGRCLGMAAVPA